MDKFLTILLVLSIFLCVMNFQGVGSYNVFDIDTFLNWLDNVGTPPAFFSDWNDNADSWLDKIAGGIMDFFAILTFPIRFIVWIVPLIIDFISTFVLYGLF